MRATLGPAVAGSWYPADPGRLADAVGRALDDAGGPDAPRRVRGVVAPHAGLVYSGRVAAHAFAALSGAAPRRVVLVGPSHHHGFHGLVVPESGALATPLGAVPVDAAAVERLAGHARVRRDDRPFLPEHALEIELPFLQTVLEPGWTVVPILTGLDVRGSVADDLAAAVAEAAGDDALWVASSDFTHHGPRFGYVPFRDDVERRLRELDRSVIGPAADRDVARFEATLDRTGATVCGRHAIGLLMRALPPAVGGEEVAYDTSGGLTGDWTHSVSYAAIRYEEPR